MHSLVRSLQRRDGFTLVELLTVMAIIAILAGLVLSISGFASKKGALSRADTEIHMLENGCASYKADNGTFPHQPLALSGSVPQISGYATSSSNVPSDLIDPKVSGSASTFTGSGSYGSASLELYEALTGDLSCSGTGGGPGVTNYIPDLRQDSLGRNTLNQPVSSPNNLVTYLSDPFGNSYGYSTANATSVVTSTNSTTGAAITSGSYPGYNATFDLWCTAGSTSNPAPGTSTDPALSWVKNW